MNKIKKRLNWNFEERSELLSFSGVSTVCEESRCPNRYECSQAGIATFMIGGSECTRACKFCHISTAKPRPLALILEKEKKQIMRSVDDLLLKYVVITSVARDDDEKTLAEHFASLTSELNDLGKEVELLIPDFHLRPEYLDLIANANPLVLAHNVETINRLSKYIRPQAGYERTLGLFDYLHENHPEVILKSGFMVGLGESMQEIEELLIDLKKAHIEIITIGQYMQPSQQQTEVVKVYSEDEFQQIEKLVIKTGFVGYEVGPFVRSSYMASRTMEKVKQAKSEQLLAET